MHYLTLGSCLKQENSYILDFIKYHRYVGVDHFVFFDREFDSLNALIGHESDVEIYHFPEIEGNIHQEAWGQLIKLNQGKTKWLALIDADQALVPVKTDNVKDVLENYEEFASLQINWKAFGSSFHNERKPGSVYERFLLTSKNHDTYNVHTQFICQPDRTLPIKVKEPHYPLLPENEVSVNTNKEVISSEKIVDLNPNTPLSFNTPALHDIMWVAHYTNKSLEEFLIKNSKGRADIFGAKMPIDQFCDYEQNCNSVFEPRVLELWLKANR